MGKRGRVSAYCAAINCTNNMKLCPDIQFYRFPLETSRWVGICYFRDFPHSFSHANSALFLGYNDILHTHFPICLFRCKQWVLNCRREDLIFANICPNSKTSGAGCQKVQFQRLLKFLIPLLLLVVKDLHQNQGIQVCWHNILTSLGELYLDNL